jgi:hypothetical protein
MLVAGAFQCFSRNITYVDMLKGIFTVNDKEGTHPNPFDLGRITNLSQLFEGQSWSFWFPTQTNPKNDGTSYPMVPAITDQDKKSLF